MWSIFKKSPPPAPIAQPPRQYDLAAEKFLDSSSIVFEDPQWLSASQKYVAGLRRAALERRLSPEPYLAPLSFLVAEQSNVKPISILDIGGGCGPCIDPAVMNAVPGAVHYTILDSPKNLALGRELFPEPWISFSTDIPESRQDIVLMSSALQYISDWRTVLARVVSLRPTFIYLSRLPTRHGGTVAVRQSIHLPNLIGSVWHWLFKQEDIVAALPGYSLMFDAFIRDLTGEMAEASGEIGRCDLRVLVFQGKALTR